MKKVIYEANVTPANGGFGEYDAGEVININQHLDLDDGQSYTTDDYLDYLRSDCGVEIEPTNEIDGKIHNQNGHQVYKIADSDDDTHYVLIWQEATIAISGAVKS